MICAVWKHFEWPEDEKGAAYAQSIFHWRWLNIMKMNDGTDEDGASNDSEDEGEVVKMRMLMTNDDDHQTWDSNMGWKQLRDFVVEPIKRGDLSPLLYLQS